MTKKARVIGILGASGGVGASVLSCALAVRAAAAGLNVVAVDGVQLGGGLDVTMGVEGERGLRWPDIAGARGRVDGAGLVARLPRSDGVPVLSFDRGRDLVVDQQLVCEVLAALSVVHDVVVVDLPPPCCGTFDWFAVPCDDVVLLVGRAFRALAAAVTLARRLDASHADAWVCVRSPGRDHEFADAVSGALDLPLIGMLSDEGRLDVDLEHGLAPGSNDHGALAHVADQVLAQVVTDLGRTVA